MLEEVERLMREAADEVILPLFQRLSEADITEKTPGEWVTRADHDSERLLTAGLQALLPGSVVVGEEATHADASLLSRIGEAESLWLVDPLDGTANFAQGHGPFAVMVALLHQGTTVESWLLDPLTGFCATAELGGGAYLNGERVRVSEGSAPDGSPRGGVPGAALRGAALSRYLPPEVRERVARGVPALAEALPHFGCAGREYPAIVAGERDFAVFWRSLPWDHAPGVLFAQEAGAVAKRWDGSPYLPADRRTGLLVARNEAVWQRAHEILLGGEPVPPVT